MTTSTTKPRRAKRRKPKPMTEQSYPVTLDKEPDTAISHEVIQAVAKKAVLPKPKVIPFKDYVADFHNRWQIHLHEWNELIKDSKWVYDKAKPYYNKVVDRLSLKASK